MSTLSRLLYCALLLLGFAGIPQAQAAWPDDEPIRIIVPQSPGGTNDTVARFIAAELGKTLKQSVIVDNRPGAASAIGMEAVVRAKPDGYTLGLASDSAALLDVVRPQRSWSFLGDLAGVSMIGDQAIAIAVPANSPYAGLQDLVQDAKKNPGTVSFGTSGLGSSQHLVGEWLGKEAGVKLIHVPYKGGGQAITDLVGGHVSFAVLGLAPMLAQQRAGKVRILAVTTAARAPALPDVPTLAELGYSKIKVAQWAGLVMRKDVPAPIATKLSDALQTVLAGSTVREQLLKAGIQPQPLPAPAFQNFLRDYIRNFSDLVSALSLKLQ